MTRFWEIDFARGVAVILMVIFNYAFVLRYFGIYIFDGFLFWWLFPRAIGAVFIFIAGLSLSISYSRLKNKGKAYRKYILRGAKIFSLGLLITLATLLVVPSAFIVFGILHFLGAAITLSPLFLRMRNSYLLIAAAVTIATGFYLQTLTFEFPWLLWLGFVPENFFTLDYFPLFPWIGIMLAGTYAGNVLYKNARRKKLPQMKGSKLFCLLGRKSLLIYMLHQPLLIVILFLLGYTIF